MQVRHYRDLKIWQLGQEISLDIYRITQGFPKHELFSLTSQIRRAGVSISSNIAEGFNRRSKKEFSRFLLIALGSCAEVETQLDIGYKLGYVDKNVAGNLSEKLDHESRMLKILSDKFALSRDEARGTRDVV